MSNQGNLEQDGLERSQQIEKQQGKEKTGESETSKKEFERNFDDGQEEEDVVEIIEAAPKELFSLIFMNDTENTIAYLEKNLDIDLRFYDGVLFRQTLYGENKQLAAYLLDYLEKYLTSKYKQYKEYSSRYARYLQLKFISTIYMEYSGYLSDEMVDFIGSYLEKEELKRKYKDRLEDIPPSLEPLPWAFMKMSD